MSHAQKKRSQNDDSLGPAVARGAAFGELPDTLNQRPQVQAQLKLDDSLNQRNKTGMPDGLKAGIEEMSGLSLDDVKVHYNSPQPAQLNALAYAQGTDIHVAPGQEQHLPHEAWHVVQQAQGRVRPTMQAQGVDVNDDPGLEREADVMGAKALHSVAGGYPAAVALSQERKDLPAEGPVQLLSKEDRMSLEKFVRDCLVENALTVDDKRVQRIMAVVDPPQSNSTLEEAQLQARAVISNMAKHRAPTLSPHESMKKKPTSTVGTSERRRHREMYRFDPLRSRRKIQESLRREKVESPQEKRERERREGGMNVAENLTKANIKFVGNRWDKHLKDGTAKIEQSEVVNRIHQGEGVMYQGRGERGGDVYYIEYGKGLTIVFSTEDGGVNVDVFHIGPGAKQ